MQDHIDLVRSEFRFVFKNILDKEHFEGKIYFRDPITKVSIFRGKIPVSTGALGIEMSQISHVQRAWHATSLILGIRGL